jgi:A/G-specific adenine glycosylase
VNEHEDLVREAAERLAELPAFEHNLPWRGNRTPYRIFLAEFLLVRTRSDVVAELFEDIVARYPDLASLAAADEEELAAVLRPLGLKKRVPLLIRGARYLMQQHAGRIPGKIEDLLEVPGLGPYTAVAIASFAFDLAEVPADVNILRFLSRLTGIPMVHPTKGSAELRALLPLLSQKLGGPKPENLLDFTRVVCRSRSPACSACPLSGRCVYSLISADKE